MTLESIIAEMSALKSIVNKQQNIIDHLQESVNSLEIKNQSLETQNQSLEVQNQCLETQNQSLEVQNHSVETLNQSLEIKIQTLETLTELLQTQLARFNRHYYGAKTEAMSADQLSLFEETRTEDFSAIEQLQDQADQHISDDQQTLNKKKRKPAVARHPLPDHLERVEVIHLPKIDGVEDISNCSDWVHVRDDIKETLEMIPARFFVKRHIYPNYVNSITGEMVCASRPAAIIDGGYASAGLLSWVVTSKYLDHLPLNRIEQIAAREGVTLSRSTLADWIGRVGSALAPLFNVLQTQLLNTTVLHADETPVDQLDPKTPKKNHKSYLWVYRHNSLDPQASALVLFDYQNSRSGEHVRQFLSNFSGHLMVDDYAGYKALFKRTDNPVIELACWAHARRKFFELYDASKNTMAKAVLDQIAQLYQIESNIKALGLDERVAIRKTQAMPILDKLYTYLTHQSHILAPSSSSAKAVNYTLKRWQALIRYANSGDLPIDNNPAENAIRPIALGRKNWLFIGSESAGKRAAVIMSLLSTAKANGLNPAMWLTDTLERLPTTKNKDINRLLPLKNWQAHDRH